MPQKVLITGGSGFIGTNLTLKLKEQGYEVLNLSKHEPEIGVETLKLDLATDDLSLLEDHEIDYVIHLAAISSEKNARGKEEQTMQVNLDGTKKLLDYFAAKPPKKFIFMSSITVYQEVDTDITEDEGSLVDQEANIYSYSKYLAEQECQKYEDKIPMLIFRLANSYGPYQRVGSTPTLIPQIISQALRDKRIEIYNGNFARDFIYISDVVDVVLKAITSDEEGILNLGTGKPTKVRDIANTIASKLGLEVTDLQIEIDAPLELVPNVAMLKDKLNWEPKVSLEDGLNKTVEFYQGLSEKSV